MDKPTEQKISLLHPKVREDVTKLINQANEALTGRAQVRVVQGLRTFEEQAQIFAQGRTKPGKVVTKAKAGQSFHNYGVAIDFCLVIDGKEISWDANKDWDDDSVADWVEVIKIFEAAGWKSGKSFADLPHLEKTFGLSWGAMLKKYGAGDFISGTKYINL